MKNREKTGKRRYKRKKKPKKEWVKVIYRIMENNKPVCTTRDMGELLLLDLGKQKRDRGMRRILSLKEFKGMTEKQVMPKYLAIVATCLYRLEDRNKIESLDTHTFLRKVYFLKEFREQVTSHVLHKIQENKRHPIIPAIMKYFSDHDTASYPDLAYFLSVENISFNRDRLRSAVKNLEDMGFIKRTGFRDEDPNLIVIHKPYLSMDTIRNKLNKLREQVLGERQQASLLGREFERKIDKILKKRDIIPECVTFNFKNLQNTHRIEFDRVFKINIDPLDMGRREVYIVVESKAGRIYTVTREDVRNFISKIKKLDQLNVIPILLSRRKLGHKVQEVCNNFGVLTYTRDDM